MGCKHLSLSWEDGVLDAVRKLGVLTTVDVYGMYDTPVVDYTGKVNPVVNTGTMGNGKAEFQYPHMECLSITRLVIFMLQISLTTEYRCSIVTVNTCTSLEM